MFPIVDGTTKLFGRDHGVRESTPKREKPVRSEDPREELQGNSERSQPTETKDDAEARKDFWSMEGDFIHFASCRTSSSTPRVERRNIPNSTEMH